MWFVAGAVVVILVLAVLRRQRSSSRRHEARTVAAELLPEIRALMESSDPNGPSDGQPAPARHYEALHQRLPQVLPNEQYFAVETFYQCVASYREARAAMERAFAEDDERSLGDRIRAKDRRDRCLKDLYYTGHAAIQKLEETLA